MTTYERAGTVYIHGIDFDFVKGFRLTEKENDDRLKLATHVRPLIGKDKLLSLTTSHVGADPVNCSIDALLDKVEIGKNMVSVTMPQESYKDKNNIVLYVNRKYVAQSWHGKRYYSFAPSHAGGNAGFVAILALKKGDIVEVDLRDGQPGANGKKIRALAKITVTDEMLAGKDIKRSSVENGEKKGHYPYT